MDIFDSIKIYLDSLKKYPELYKNDKEVIDRLYEIVQDRSTDPLKYIEIILKQNDLLRTDCLSYEDLLRVEYFIFYLKEIIKNKDFKPLFLLEKIDPDGKIIKNELDTKDDYFAFNNIPDFNTVRNFLKPYESFFYDLETNVRTDELLLIPKNENTIPIEIFCKRSTDDSFRYKCNCGIADLNASFPSLLRKMT